ncbi:GerMN domain-containing protein [Clostridium sp. MB05]|uniref:GerMN domain-containing protein n=1 Tax=Clostridium sp. MB05 TaxID=3376682 RepID=UPI0039823892
MKKNIIATLLLLFIPFSIISCTPKTPAKNDTTSNINVNENNSSKINVNENNLAENDTINKENNNTPPEIINDNAKIYYYDAVNDKIVYINETIEIKNKAVATALVNELKKAPNDEVASSISTDISLISANVDEDKDCITLNFSSNFVKAQNLGGGAESSTLNAICNTFGNYFNVKNVIITLEGKPYSSGHILMKDGEAFKVDLSNTVELSK